MELSKEGLKANAFCAANLVKKSRLPFRPKLTVIGTSSGGVNGILEKVPLKASPLAFCSIAVSTQSSARLSFSY